MKKGRIEQERISLIDSIYYLMGGNMKGGLIEWDKKVV